MSGSNKKDLAKFIFLIIVGILPLFLTSANPLLSSELSIRRNAIVLAVEKVSPAVVNINTEEIIKERINPFSAFREPFFEEFFRDFYKAFPQRNFKKQSLGSGVIINPKGYILTNAHVVSRATKINVTLSNKKEYQATVVGADVKSDLAIIKIDSKDKLPFARMGRSDDLLIGETIIAIGNPFGLSHTVTSGVISATRRSIKGPEDKIYHDFIQIDASINPGNSGGPLININGEVIGINTAIYQKGEGIGFAIPINKAKRIIDDLIAYGRVHEAWLGVAVQDITQRLAEYFNFKDEGVLISKIYKKSPADRSGLKVGDIIISIEDIVIKNKRDYRGQISAFTPDDKVKLTLFRHNKKLTKSITAKALPKNLALEIAKELLGVSVENITPSHIKKYRLFTKKGVLIKEVQKNSLAHRIGIEPGDIIRQIDQQRINNIEDFKKGIISARNRDSILLLVQRGSNGYYITLEL